MRLAIFAGIETKSLLAKVKIGEKQAHLDYKDRIENVREMYEVLSSASIVGKSILLIDDVLTTSATVLSCMQSLLMAGAKEVYVITLGKTSNIENISIISISSKITPQKKLPAKNYRRKIFKFSNKDRSVKICLPVLIIYDKLILVYGK